MSFQTRKLKVIPSKNFLDQPLYTHGKDWPNKKWLVSCLGSTSTGNGGAAFQPTIMKTK